MQPIRSDLSLYAQFNRNLDAMLQKNLQQLRVTHPELTAQILPHVGLETYRLKLILQNNTVEDIEVTYADGQVLRLNDKQKQEEDLKKLEDIPLRQVFLLFGIHLGIFLDIIFNATKNTFYPAYPHLNMHIPFYVVEPDISRFLFLMRMVDLTEIFQSKRIYFFIGVNCLENVKIFFTNPDVRYPMQIISSYKSIILDKLIQIIEDGQHRKKANSDYYHQKNNEYYESRSRDEWHSILKGEIHRPLRIMVSTSLYTSFLQYAARDLLSGFKRLGCETVLLMENDHTHLLSNLSVLQKIYLFHPDIFIILDHFRWEQDKAIPDKIPLVSWIQDILPWSFKEDPDHRLTDYDFVFSFSKYWIESGLFNVPIFNNRKIHFLPVGINCDIYYKKENQKKDIDILYVSHITDPELNFNFLNDIPYQYKLHPPEFHITEKKILSIDTLLHMYKELYEQVKKFDYSELWQMLLIEKHRLQFLNQFLQNINIPSTPEIHTLFVTNESRFILHLIDLIKAKPLIYLAQNNIPLHIYGSNWGQFEHLRPFAMGTAKNGEFLNDLMNRSRICINNSGGTSLHMRTLEIFGCGAFLLTREIPKELDTCSVLDYFTDGVDMVLFKDEKDLLIKVQYYLTHEEEREAIAKQGMQKALSIFGYDILAKHVIDTIANEL
ncbi:MAG: glycosyltransferase [Magnetococcus sp. DMHC-6]